MVSMLFCYTKPFQGARALFLDTARNIWDSENLDQRRCLGDNSADAPCVHAVLRESREGIFGVVRRNGHKKTAGRLRIKKEILIFRRDARLERGTLPDEGSIFFEATGEMPLARGFDSARKIRERRVIDFERDRLQSVRGIAQRHLARVAEEAEAGHVGYGVNGLCVEEIFVELLQGGGRGSVQSAHRT